MKRYTWYISKKLTISQKGKGSSPAYKVAICGVALSVAIMILSIAIVNGFKREITNRITGFNSEIIVYPSYSSENLDDNLVELTTSFKELLDCQPYIESYHLISSLPAILKTDDNFKGIYLRGVGNDYDLSFIKESIVNGSISDFSLADNQNHIYISQQVANELNLNVGDEVNTYFIDNNIRVRKLKIAAIYNTHFEDYDNHFIIGNIKIVQDLCGFMSTQGSAIEIQTKDFNDISTDTYNLFETLTTAAIDGIINSNYKIDNVVNTEASYFGWLALLDTNVVVILILMIVVASFSLISVMLILIIEKIQVIGILKTLGSTNNEISRIFILLSTKISLFGLLIGNILAIALIYFQSRFHFLKLDPQAYYIDYVPIEINSATIVVLNIITLIIIWLVLLIPSRMVSKISPSETMKYE